MISIIKHNVLLGVIFLIFPLIFIIIGGIGLYATSQTINRCTYKETAVITDVRRNIDHSRTWAISYSYDYHGDTYDVRGNTFSTDYRKYDEGDEITIWIDPDNPEDQIFDKKTNNYIWLIFIIVGASFYGFYLLFDIAALKKRGNTNVQ